MTDGKTVYGFGTEVQGSMEEVEKKVTDALQEQGFGVLTRIDVAATLKAKLGVDEPPYVILGACNPTLAHQALQAEREIGLLLPCNVVLWEEGEENVAVRFIEPEAMLGVTGRDDIRPLAREVRGRLEKVMASLA